MSKQKRRNKSNRKKRANHRARQIVPSEDRIKKYLKLSLAQWVVASCSAIVLGVLAAFVQGYLLTPYLVVVDAYMDQSLERALEEEGIEKVRIGTGLELKNYGLKNARLRFELVAEGTLIFKEGEKRIVTVPGIYQIKEDVIDMRNDSVPSLTVFKSHKLGAEYVVTVKNPDKGWSAAYVYKGKWINERDQKVEFSGCLYLFHFTDQGDEEFQKMRAWSEEQFYCDSEEG